jgi:hypothetical protein
LVVVSSVGAPILWGGRGGGGGGGGGGNALPVAVATRAAPPTPTRRPPLYIPRPLALPSPRLSRSSPSKPLHLLPLHTTAPPPHRLSPTACPQSGHGQGRAATVRQRPWGDERRRRRIVREPPRVRARAGADAAARGAAGLRGDGARGGDEPRAGAVGRPHGARAALVGPRRAGPGRHGGGRGLRHHGPRHQALRGARGRRVLRHCRPLRAALRLLLHRVRRRHARRRRRLQLPPRHLRSVISVHANTMPRSMPSVSWGVPFFSRPTEFSSCDSRHWAVSEL